MELTTIDRHFYKKLASQMNRIRENKCKSYRELSEETGLSRTALDNFFLGRVRAKDYKFQLICKAIGIEPETVLETVLNM